MNHDEIIEKIILSVDADTGFLKSRESITVEFKESFNMAGAAKYAKTLAAFANNRGGHIVFGVKDNPRKVIGLRNNLENLVQDRFSEILNSLFAPSIEWCCGTYTFTCTDREGSNGNSVKPLPSDQVIGWIYAEEAEQKPVIAQKNDTGEKITSGDIFYRYRARTEKVKYAEMNKIIDERANREREKVLTLIEQIRQSGTANLGIINYNNGKFSTPYGVDVAIEKKLVVQVLKKAKFIKEGCFDDIHGIPVIKVTGNIDLSEEIPVPDFDPDKGYPYIQKFLAEKLQIEVKDLYALIWYFKMKESKKYHIEVTVSKKNKIHKFSDFAFQFLQEKISDLQKNEMEFNEIRSQFKTSKLNKGN